ncbi:MAG: L,D-transpeptidase family protein [Sphingomicrobium sp.]|nr:L,D-transpeptidase family protein [Sphingomonadales bacterium]
MRIRSTSRMMVAALALTGGSIALAQRPADPIAPLPTPGAQQMPSAPLVTPPPPPAPPVVLPPPLWSVADAQELLSVIQSIGIDGLAPADYAPGPLAAAIQSGDANLLASTATDSFNKLSSDLALGHVRGEDRIDWHVVDKDLDSERQRALLEGALAQHRVEDALRGLLPTHPQYGALRIALAEPRNAAVANVIRLNMDRWRWLPRDLGTRYIIANVPAYTATLVENGVALSRHKAVAGAIKTPTPQLSAMATGVILNPWWEVPTSISHEVAGKGGFVPVKDPKTGQVQRWRQPPGPSNALGQMKFVMPNPYAIYLHDTNAKSRFNSQVRAFSHGCIRTDHIGDLARLLLAEDGGAWDDAKVSEMLASKKTTPANFVKPLPAYIVYFTAAATLDGTIVNYDDVYKRDGVVIAALLDRPRPKPKSTAPEAALATSAATKTDTASPVSSAARPTRQVQPVPTVPPKNR